MQKTNKPSNVLIFILMITMMLVVRDLMDVSINKYIFVAVIIAFCLFSSKDDIPAMACFLFPLLWGLPYTWFIAPITIIYLLKKKHIKRKVMFLIGFFVLAEIIATLWYPEEGLINIIKYLSVISTFFVFLYEEEVDKKSCINAFTAGLVVLCAVIFIKTLMTAPSNWLDLFVKGWFRFGMQQVEEGSDITLKVNANSLAYYSVTGVALGLVGIDQYEKRKRILSLVATLFFILMGVMTLSRSWMVAVALCILLFLVGRARSFRSAAQTVLIGVVAVIAIAYVIQVVPELREGFIGRWQSSDVATGNERTDLFWEYHGIWLSNIRYILTGTGVTQYKQITGVYHGLHNMLQQIFLSYGVIGAAVFFYGIFSPLQINKKKRSLIMWTPLVAVLLFVQTIQFVYPEALMLPYIIAMYVLKVKDDEEIHNYS